MDSSVDYNGHTFLVSINVSDLALSADIMQKLAVSTASNLPRRESQVNSYTHTARDTQTHK